jgi:hypothetical protein
MTRLRATITRGLKEAQNTAAMLTTFNEVDMGAPVPWTGRKPSASSSGSFLVRVKESIEDLRRLVLAI